MTMTPAEYNMKQLNLRNWEYELHRDLMGRPMCEWPESLQEYVQERTRTIGLCGDVIATAVADWIRHA